MNIRLNSIKLDEKSYKSLNDLYETLNEVIAKELKRKFAWDKGIVKVSHFSVREYIGYGKSIIIEDCEYTNELMDEKFLINIILDEK